MFQAQQQAADHQHDRIGVFSFCASAANTTTKSSNSQRNQLGRPEYLGLNIYRDAFQRFLYCGVQDYPYRTAANRR